MRTLRIRCPRRGGGDSLWVLNIPDGFTLDDDAALRLAVAAGLAPGSVRCEIIVEADDHADGAELTEATATTPR
jgi:hypothetical protein